ncbi:NAD-dependent epimerase/dehydratase family protein [bacterium]|nr:NAD-dependent epimerase/dehydratase family protein [bacterium]
MKRILITGANSYIGVSVEKWLLGKPNKYQIDTLDMKDTNWKEHDFSHYDVIFHVAGIAHADIGNVSKETKEMYYKVNTELTIETAKKAKKNGVRQFIFMSSMIVYGGQEYITRETIPQPSNFYGDSKWKADCGVQKLADENFHVVVLRPPMIYGKDSKGNYPVLAKIAKRLLLFPKVNNKRSVLYIENLCKFVELMIDNEETGVFFPQNDRLVNTSELVQGIAEVYGRTLWVSKSLTPIVWIGKHMPGKIGKMCNKAFGNSWYDLQMSVYDDEYRIYNLKESLERTERGRK